MEIYFNNTWYTVCDIGWDLTDAEVVCRELGYGPVISTRYEMFYGQGSDHISFDNVSCVGTERTISECLYGGWRIGNCYNESAVAGIKCADPNGKYFLNYCYVHMYICVIIIANVSLFI